MGAATAQFVNYYDVLQVSPTASTDEITEAVRKQRRLWTKRTASSNAEVRADAERRMRDIDAASRILTDASLRGQFDRAFQDYRPPAPSAPTEGGDQDWTARASSYLDSGNPSFANYAAREAISRDGANDRAWYLRAHSSFLMGRPRDAEYEFQEAIRLRPDNPLYHFDLGEAYFTIGQFRESLREYESALSIEPKNPMYKTGVATVYLATDDSRRALLIMEEVVAAAPDEEVFQYYLAVALHDFTLSQWAELANGSYIIICPAQIELTKRLATRALGLKYDDPQLRASLKDNLRLAAKAEASKWTFPSHPFMYAIGFLIFLGLSFAGGAATAIGLLAVVGIVVTFVLRHHKPAWKFIEADTRGMRKSEGLRGLSIPSGTPGLGNAPVREALPERVNTTV